MDRVILHSDINSCYASIEHAMRPELADVPLAVGGSAEDRHGIILAKDEACKRAGVKTGMALWQARQVCPGIVIVHPRMDVYLDYARHIQEIYSDYTNLREPFGIDESWLDLTDCWRAGDGMAAAQEIRERVRAEMGVTVSIGVSWNKIFAKLGSDYKKPDAVTGISRENYREIVWPLPVEDLLYVGRATGARLRSLGISTIGALARTDPEVLHRRLGKMGYVLHAFANGLDSSPVRREDLHAPVKSVGNSTTAPRDLVCDEDVRITMLALAESVGARLRAGGFKSRLLSVSVRSTALVWRGHQLKLDHAADGTRELMEGGMALFRELHSWRRDGPLRSLGLSAGALESADAPEQLDLFGLDAERRRQSALDGTLDALREKYGFGCVHRGLAGLDMRLGSLNAREDHTVHPIGFFGGH